MNMGKLVVISGPSGIGKGTVCKELIQKDKSVVPSVSWTTRERRKGEEEGVTYFYRTDGRLSRICGDLRRALRHAARLCRSKNA